MTPLLHSVSRWNLAGLSERVAKETVDEINLQFHVRRLRETWRSKTRDQLGLRSNYLKSYNVCDPHPRTRAGQWRVAVLFLPSQRREVKEQREREKKSVKQSDLGHILKWLFSLKSRLKNGWNKLTRLRNLSFRVISAKHAKRKPEWKAAAASTLLASHLCSVGVSVSYLACVVLRPCFSLTSWKLLPPPPPRP